MPFLVIDVGVEITPDMVPALGVVPSKVNAKAPVPAVPLHVSVPEEVAVIVLADPNVMGPL